MTRLGSPELSFASLALALGLPLASALPAQDTAPSQPRWIWTRARAGADEVCRFRRVLDLPEPVRRAKLRMTCDNEFEARLDGVSVLKGDQWQRGYATDVTERLHRGKVTLSVRAENQGGPAGLIGRLDIELRSGTRLVVVTDASWEAAPGGVEEAAASWQPAHDLGPADTAPWKDPFVPKVATPAASLHTKSGYSVELIRSAQDDEGSWISMTFGPSGELYLGVERGGILRLRDPRASLEALILPPEVRNPHGLAFAFDALWANVNDKKGGLFRLRDADSDGEFEDVQKLVAWNGSGEHGSHAVVPGPDGNLWVVNGNMTSLPAGVAADSPHRLYAEDVLLERYEDPNGHAVGVRVPGSHVLRIRPDGTRIDLWAAGMRNAFDLAFDGNGDLYTFDSDMEWDVGLPWYRPIRVCRIVWGAEFGWRSGSAKWPVESFDSLPGLIDLGRGSPTGITFWRQGLVRPEDRGALVLADWAFGRILAARTHPAGEPAAPLVSGKPLNVTDVVVGPDGALWFVTGGRGTQSGLYRLAADTRPDARGTDVQATAAGLPSPADQSAGTGLLLGPFGGRRLANDAEAIDLAWVDLGDADRERRQVARVALERAPVELWRARALSESEPARAMAALLALARAGVDADLGSILDRLDQLAYADLPRARRLEWLRVASVAMARRGDATGERRQRLVETLTPPAGGPLPSGDFALDRERATVLVALDADGLVPALLAALAGTPSQVEQIAWAQLLCRTRVGWSEADATRFFEWTLDVRARGEGGNSFGGYLDAMLDTLLERLGSSELVARLQAARAAAVEARAERAAKPGPFVRAWTTEELVDALPAVAAGRSFAGGQRAFATSQCVTCHRFLDKGGAIGPDLTGVSRRLDRRTLLESILEPSKVISDQYQLVTFTLRDGRVRTGRVRAETDEEVEIVVDVEDGSITRLRKADVTDRSPSPVSAMPPGLVFTLTREQILDLLAYLENDGDKDADAFK
ncbi:MAG: c-type cytochrome [Planctomycetota bacterium]